MSVLSRYPNHDDDYRTQQQGNVAPAQHNQEQITAGIALREAGEEAYLKNSGEGQDDSQKEKPRTPHDLQRLPDGMTRGHRPSLTARLSSSFVPLRGGMNLTHGKTPNEASLEIERATLR